MRLTQLAAKPQLVKVVLDDEDTLREYNEPIEFWIWDRQSMDRFIRLASLKSENIELLVEAVKEMVLDENGVPVLNDEKTLPTSVMTRVIGRVVETLGK